MKFRARNPHQLEILEAKLDVWRHSGVKTHDNKTYRFARAT